jgi:hypothetical protein
MRLKSHNYSHDAPRWPAVHVPKCHRLREVPFHIVDSTNRQNVAASEPADANAGAA